MNESKNGNRAWDRLFSNKVRRMHPPVNPKSGRAILVVMAVALSAASCAKTPLVVRLGVVANFEGQNPKVSLDCFKSIKLAYQDFSAKYPEALKLELKPIDDSWDPVKIRSAYATVIQQCDVILFDTTSTAFLAIYPDVLKHPEKLHMLVGPTTTSISGHDDNVLRNGIDMKLEQTDIASFLNNLGLKNLLVVRENKKNAKYTEQALGFFRKVYAGQVTVAEFSAIDIDLDACLKALRSESFDSVYILAGSTPQAAGIVIQNIKKEFPHIEIVTTPWVRGQELLETAGPAMERVIVSSHVILSGGNEMYNLYEKAFMKAFGGSHPSCYAPLTYDAATILFEAIRTTRTCEAATLKRAILGNCYQGTSGTIRFDPTGDTSGGLFFFRIKAGSYVPVD